MRPLNKREIAFVQTVHNYFVQHGRHDLPWRKTKNPYRILVSEIMLQQTQVDRVIPKYKAFLKVFPTVRALADASLGDVLRAWQGLGYNRRAKMLHNAAKQVVTVHNGRFPRTHEALMALPGIGHYTAGAVMAFAYNTPIPIIETNIRTVYLYHFFKKDSHVADYKVLEKVARTLAPEQPRTWYWALMDYGTHLKKTHGNPNVRSRTYAKQSKFKGSDREVRGAIVRALTSESHTENTLLRALPFKKERVTEQLQKLCAELMVTKKGHQYLLPE
ncbi:MAG: A/G-specific adenine glycosylase [Candidatus Pacebacteria bacterium]|nr:A/G-specific adenine glycosylase [Candidatus Paceibacterota bacterium]